MYYDKLEKQKRIIVKERKYNIFFLTMGLLFFLPCLWMTFYDLRVLLIAWVPLALILGSIKWIAENNRLIEQFSCIVKNNAIRKTCEITLDCPKIAFRLEPGANTRGSASKTICAITFKDRRKRKFYYFFDESMTLSYSSAQFKRIQSEFRHELHIQCYENTSIVRTIENDPRFLHIKFGSI